MQLERPRNSAYASRADYQRLLDEFSACDSIDAIDILMSAEKQTISLFPESWEELILNEYQRQRQRIIDAHMENMNAPA